MYRSIDQDWFQNLASSQIDEDDAALAELVKKRIKDIPNAIIVTLDGLELMPDSEEDNDFGFDGESG